MLGRLESEYSKMSSHIDFLIFDESGEELKSKVRLSWSQICFIATYIQIIQTTTSACLAGVVIDDVDDECMPSNKSQGVEISVLGIDDPSMNENNKIQGQTEII